MWMLHHRSSVFHNQLVDDDHLHQFLDNLILFSEVYSPPSVKSSPQTPTLNLKASIYHNASQLHDNDSKDRIYLLPTRRTTNDHPTSASISPTHGATINETYDQPKSYDNVAVMSTAVDRNNNHVFVPPPRQDKSKTDTEKS